MPDFTFEIFQQCKVQKIWNINNYTQTGIGTENPACNCKGFQYHGKCKHIRQAQEEMCQYHEMIHGSPEIDGICPFCGNETEYVKVAV